MENKDYRCFTPHYFFRVHGAGRDGGPVYATINAEMATSVEDVVTAEGFLRSANRMREGVAEVIGSDIEDVEIIDKTEYFENIDDESDNITTYKIPLKEN